MNQNNWYYINWYYIKDGKQEGPISESNLGKLLDNGHLRPDTLVWCEFLTEWIPASQVGAAFQLKKVLANDKLIRYCYGAEVLKDENDIMIIGTSFTTLGLLLMGFGLVIMSEVFSEKGVELKIFIMLFGTLIFLSGSHYLSKEDDEKIVIAKNSQSVIFRKDSKIIKNTFF